MRIAGFDAVDLAGGTLVIVSGIALMLDSATYPIGTLHRMGPGYLPLVTGAILTGIGVALVVVSRATFTEPLNVRFRPFFAIFAGLIWFALTIERFGLVVSITGMVILTSLAPEKPNWIMMAATAAFLIVMSVGVFIYGLHVPLYTIRY